MIYLVKRWISPHRAGTLKMEKLEIKSWWDLRHGETIILEIYALIVSEAMSYRDEAKTMKKGSANYQIFTGIEKKLWQIAAALENTEEVNPTK